MISVIVPVYNTGRFLNKCLDSLLAQTFTDFEIIIINDGSTDNSPSICDSYAKEHANIKVVHKANEGLVEARKTGCLHSIGEYLAFVDSDDWVAPDFLERLYDNICVSNADISICGFMVAVGSQYTPYQNKVRPGVYKMDEELWTQIFPASSNFEFGLYPVYWNKLFKRSVIYESMMKVPKQVNMGEDVAGVFPAIYVANQISIIDDPLYFYRQINTSMTKSFDTKYFDKLYVLIKYLKTQYGEKCFSDNQVASYSYYMINHGITTLFGKNNPMSLSKRIDILNNVSNNSDWCRVLLEVGRSFKDNLMIDLANRRVKKVVCKIYANKILRKVIN